MYNIANEFSVSGIIIPIMVVDPTKSRDVKSMESALSRLKIAVEKVNKVNGTGTSILEKMVKK